MKYYNEAAQSFHYDVAFYEVAGGIMYIYCPNCGQVEEVDIKKYGSVGNAKKSHIPSCRCYIGIPKYKHARGEHRDVHYSFDWAEFSKDEARDEIHLCGYRYTATFAASDYDGLWTEFDEGNYILKRHPVIDSEKSIDITFHSDGRIEYRHALYHPMWTRVIKVGAIREVKNWSTLFMFNLAEGSFAELKGTWLEQYITILKDMHEKLGERVNADICFNEFTVMLLILLIKFPSVKKLWSAGYKCLILDRVLEKLFGRYGYCYAPEYYLGSGCWARFKCSNGAVNYKGKSLERILGIEPSKLSALGDRETLDADDLRLAKKCYKAGLAITSKNMEIFASYRYDELFTIANKSANFKLSKLFKYIRHQGKHVKTTSILYIVSDYVDYLKALLELKTPLTEDVLYPTSLKAAHDRTVQEVKLAREKGKEKAFRNAVAPFVSLNAEDDTYSIKVIDSVSKLIKEAAKMHNCSADYIDRIVARNSILFVIREKVHPRKPFCMLELSPARGDIVQNRGVHNTAVPPDVDAFADRWLKKIRRKLKNMTEAA